MLRNLPTSPYCGITFVLSNPSRFDKDKLLTNKAEDIVNTYCLRPHYNIHQCDVRLADDPSDFLPNTKCIVLLGEYAMHKMLPETKDNILNEMRGSPFYWNNIPCIATYFPQDCIDVYKDYESKYNELSHDFNDESESDEEGEGDVKRFSQTKRSNFSFWLKKDIEKAKKLVQSGAQKWPVEPEPTYKLYPPSDEVIHVLRTTKGQWMDYDKETDYEEQNPLCFAFTFDGGTVYSVPILDNNYQPAYSSFHYILRALAIAIRDNTLVAHNGAAFDFLVLGYKLGIPIVKVWDTMVAMHRCYPDIEISLGHATSLFTYQKFHKDSNPGAYFTREHMMNMLRYCGKDVFTMHLIRKQIQAFAKTVPGLEDSIECAMKSIRPYITTTMQGIRYDDVKLKARVKENDRLMMQYMRCIEMLIGKDNLEEIKRASVKGKKASFFPSSNTQTCHYFHNMLGYRPAGWGKPSKIDGRKKPSLNKKAMYKLRLRYDNPVIDFINMYRYVRLEVTTPLGFLPWKSDDGNIIKPVDTKETSSQRGGYGTSGSNSLFPSPSGYVNKNR